MYFILVIVPFKLPKLNGISTKSFVEKLKRNSLMVTQKHEKILNRYLGI